MNITVTKKGRVKKVPQQVWDMGIMQNDGWTLAGERQRTVPKEVIEFSKGINDQVIEAEAEEPVKKTRNAAKKQKDG
jgi:hypothetical protein